MNDAKDRHGRTLRILHSKNPFMNKGIIKETKQTRKFVHGRTDGEVLFIGKGDPDQAEPHSISVFGGPAKAVDGTKFIKLFVGGVKRLKELTSAGTKVFEVLYYVMQDDRNINKDRIYITHSFIDKEYEIKIGKTTFHKGLSELIDKDFLAASDVVGWFWVNPDFMWNGDRLAFIQSYRRKETKEITDKQNKVKAAQTLPLPGFETGLEDREDPNEFPLL